MSKTTKSSWSSRIQEKLRSLVLYLDNIGADLLHPQALAIPIIIIILVIILWTNFFSIIADPNKLSAKFDINANVREKRLQFLQNQYSSGQKYILVWTSCFEIRNCGFHTGQPAFDHCPAHRKCIITSNKQLLSQASVVLFHIRDLNNILHLNLPAYHDPEQIWVFFTQESPYYTYLGNALFRDYLGNLAVLDGKFNATMTYMRDSDVFSSYGRYAPASKHDEPTSSSKTMSAASKTKFALWFVSNCDAKLFRSGYVKELQKYIPIDIYGACGKPDPCQRNSTCLWNLYNQYKFYLSFENSQCKDYITEKFWRTLSYNILPVALGAWVEDYAALAPPNSFLHVDNFTDPQLLANYLLYLDKNNSAYEEYFAWKKQYRSFYDHSAVCKLCDLAYNKTLLRKSTAYNVSEWFSSKRLCRDTVGAFQ